MTDLISRQAAINTLNDEYHGMISDESMKIYQIINWLSELPSAQRWIPVSERLPEVNTRCLCTYEHKEGTCIDFGLYMKRGWFVSGVTAWMPLPKPYKEERK